MKQKIQKGIVESQKAIAAIAGALTLLADMSFVPAPYAGWIGAALVVLTGLATYVLPYVEHVVENGADISKDVPGDPMGAMKLVDDYWKQAKDDIEHGTVRHAADITAEIPKVVEPEPTTVEAPVVTTPPTVTPAAAETTEVPAAAPVSPAETPAPVEGPETSAMPLDQLRAELTAPDQHDPTAPVTAAA